jgi:hypothetical protein
MSRFYYKSTIAEFLGTKPNEILGELVRNSIYPIETTQRDAWLEEIRILANVLTNYQGTLFLEYDIPRMGKRIDTVLLIESVIFVIEFKIGEKLFTANAVDQVWDYALDLKYFHETSSDHFIVPILVATQAASELTAITQTPHDDMLVFPIKSNVELLGKVIAGALSFCEGQRIDQTQWGNGRYLPTPTIVEAAMALYRNHSVENISRSDASAINLAQTSAEISKIIEGSRLKSSKSICFVTGVPGAGKTLVGLNIATKHIDKNNESYSVFLSGNGPLVAILREALARDKVLNEKEKGNKIRKAEALRVVKLFIQNVHNFRDDCLANPEEPPFEHVAIFDEAQRAWNIEQTKNFMKRRKRTPNFAFSEPEFLISCLNRHHDWAVVICLVGGGQEINTGEAGIGEWIDSLVRSYPDWHIHISPRLQDSEYGAGTMLDVLKARENVFLNPQLHLAISMRSFRAENVSTMVKQMLDIDIKGAKESYKKLAGNYPIAITRNLAHAKQWVKGHARGSERYGIVVSSQAERLKPHAIDVKAPVDPIHWFLDGKEDVRSSYYLEDVATEFQIQGLELDWACVTWDGDFRFAVDKWEHWSFCGDKWNHIRKIERQNYLKNAYRVLLTRARQGMVIVVPEGDPIDPTRKKEYYDSTYEYLCSIGFKTI